MEAPNALPAGHALQEYRIEKVLGVGGFGLTYLALDENLHLRVAVKEYLPADIAARASDRTIAPRSDESAEIFDWGRRDRKSTRLNSSHLVISYAVFCLKKKKQ